MERLQKVIANSGFCSRRKAEELISQGKVKVNNQIVTEQGTKVSNDDRIEINGTLLPLKEEKEYYLLYKPEKTISSVKDEKGRKTVTELIPSKGRIYPVGRLDYDTTGVLLLTNDGELTNILTHPKNKIEKFYRAKVTGVVTREEVMKIKKGIEIEGRKTIPTYVKVKKVNQETQTTTIYLGINEGRKGSRLYDVRYYLSNNRDLANTYGNNYSKVTEHFALIGINEGRDASSTFKISVYKSANNDLKNAFGNDNLSYYIHYMNFGVKENRKAY